MKKNVPVSGSAKGSYPTKGMMYYAVIYLLDGTVHLWPGIDKKACQSKINDILKSKWAKRVRGYSIMKRNLDHYKDGMFI